MARMIAMAGEHESENRSLTKASSDSDGSEAETDEAIDDEEEKTFSDVVRGEYEWLAHMREQRRMKGDEGPRLALAFSGGGMRAAANEFGVLWRLAEAGCLQNVEHFCVVSGGAYTASSLASHIIAEGAPGAGEDLSSWYRAVVAKAICRMQSNSGYILSDIISLPGCSLPNDGSRSVPRLCDFPLLVGYIIFTTLFNPVSLLVMYVVPIAEFINIVFGFPLRVALCNVRDPQWTESEWLRKSPFIRTSVMSVTALLLMVIIMNFFCWIVGEACKFGRKMSESHREVSKKKRWPCYLCVHSTQAMLTRLAIILSLLLVALIGFLLSEVGGGWASHGSCAEYISTVLNSTSDTCTVSGCTDRIGFQIHPGATNCSSCVGTPPWPPSCPEWCIVDEQRFERARGMWKMPGLSLLGTSIMFGLVIVMLLVPFFSVEILTKSVMLLGPLFVCLVVGLLIGYRIFGPVTKQPFPYLHVFPFHEESWNELVRWCLLAGAVLLPIQGFLASSMHIYYRRCLRLAFFADGADITWGDVAGNAFIPFMMMTGSVCDYWHPDYTHSTSELFISGISMGGQKLGYVPTPSWLSVAKCVALTGAASDAAVLGVLSKAAYTVHRFWLDITNLRMGDYIQFDHGESNDFHQTLMQSSTPDVAKRSRRHSCQLDEAIHRLVNRLPSLLFGESVYIASYVGLILMTYPQHCHTGKIVFMCGAGIQLVMYVLSFFAFARFLEWTLYSGLNQRLHMAMGFKHSAYHPPRALYVTDGGVMDPSGILVLLRRRCKRILLVQCVHDPKDEFAQLKRTLLVAEVERLASFYDLRDPKLTPELAFEEFKNNDSITYLHLGIRYDCQNSENQTELGHLFVVKTRLIDDLRGAPVPNPLTEEEIRGERAPDLISDDFGDMEQTQLGGGWCSCCHRLGCNCGPKFPHIPNSNQFLTTELFSSLCRLGYLQSEEAVRALCQTDKQDPSNHFQSGLQRPFATTPDDLNRAEDRRDLFKTGFV